MADPNRIDDSFLETGELGNLYPKNGRIDVATWRGQRAIRIAFTSDNVADSAGDVHSFWAGPSEGWGSDYAPDAIRITHGEELALTQDVGYDGDWKEPPTVRVFLVGMSPSYTPEMTLTPGGYVRHRGSMTVTSREGYTRYRLRVRYTPGESPITEGGTGYIYITDPYLGSPPLTENIFADPFFDQQMDRWTIGGQGGAGQGITTDYALPGHEYSFCLAPYVSGRGQSAGPGPIPAERPFVKKGTKLTASVWVLRGPGEIRPNATVSIRAWKSPNGVASVSDVMGQEYLRNLPVGEWVEIRGEHVYTDDDDDDSFNGYPRVYYTPSADWPSTQDARVYIGYQGGFVDPGLPKGGVAEVGVATTTREGLVGDVLARSRQKIDLKLALPDRRLRGGERIDLAAAAASASDVSWRWRQVTGPTVTLRRQGNTCSFIAPDVTETTPMRIAVSAATQEGGLRSNWEFFDLEVTPTHGRLASTGPGVFSPHTPRMVGYSRGKRELWGDVLPPVGLDPEGRHDAEIVDIGFPADDVQVVADGAPPRRAPQGGVFIDLATGDVYQNFGEGYNEDEDTTGAPRRSAIMISPATGDVFQWIEGASDVG